MKLRGIRGFHRRNTTKPTALVNYLVQVMSAWRILHATKGNQRVSETFAECHSIGCVADALGNVAAASLY